MGILGAKYMMQRQIFRLGNIFSQAKQKVSFRLKNFMKFVAHSET